MDAFPGTSLLRYSSRLTSSKGKHSDFDTPSIWLFYIRTMLCMALCARIGPHMPRDMAMSCCEEVTKEMVARSLHVVGFT